MPTEQAAAQNVLVNGKDAGQADGERVEFTSENGKTFVIRTDGDDGIAWIGDDAMPRKFGIFSADSLRSNRLSWELSAHPEGEARLFFRDRMAHAEDGLTSPAFPERMFQLGADRIRSPQMEMLLEGGAPWGSALMNPELLGMERRIEELGRQARRAEGSERERLEADLDDLLNEAFDLKMEAERKQVEDLESRIKSLRERITERADSRADIIAKRKRQLLGEKSILDW